jgi:hypothetical protein
MKVKELIAALKKFDGNLEVYSQCDHGQSPEKSNSPSEIYAESLPYCLWDDFTSYPDEAEDMGYTLKAVLL